MKFARLGNARMDIRMIRHFFEIKGENLDGRMADCPT
jgi:hypothetical protein